jgi:hypothetical protein
MQCVDPNDDHAGGEATLLPSQAAATATCELPFPDWSPFWKLGVGGIPATAFQHMFPRCDGCAGTSRMLRPASFLKATATSSRGSMLVQTTAMLDGVGSLQLAFPL